MNVYLTFDIEVWCNGWTELDARFPAAFERYVYGRSAAGDYALPKTLEIMARHGVHGVFFVEPLFAARFGVEHLATIVALIQDAGQEVQLHLHPEWTDEIRPVVFPDKPFKRQHLCFYDLDEQTALIRLGMELLDQAGAAPLTAFRAGSFAANADTLIAVERCGLRFDASLNMNYPISGSDLRAEFDFYQPRRRDGLTLLPMTTFRDGFGRLRHAQVGACSVAELQQAMEDSAARRHPCFTILSHNFEMLRAGSSRPDPVVAGRFEKLCRHLGSNRELLPTAGLASPAALDVTAGPGELSRCGALATARRYAGQAVRRLWH